MGYIRKALFITTLGLSGFVLDDDSKPATKAKARAKPRTKAKAKTSAKSRAPQTSARASSPQPKAKASAKRRQPKSARPKSKPQRVGAKPAGKPRATPVKTPLAAQARHETAQAPKAAAHPQPAAAKVPAAPASGTVIALERISKLHAQGALSDHEFAAAKARILGTSAPAPAAGHVTFPSIEANVAAARRLEGLGDSDRDAAARTHGGPGRGI